MGFWIVILGAIIIGVTFSFTSGGDGSNGRGGAGNGGSKTHPLQKSDFPLTDLIAIRKSAEISSTEIDEI